MKNANSWMGKVETAYIQTLNDKLKENSQLKNNQEKHTEKDLEHHKPEDLKPTDLPADWKKQLEDKKQLEKDLTQKNNDLIKALQDRGDLLKKELDQQEEITNLTKKVNALEKQPTTPSKEPTGGDSKPDSGLQKKYDDLVKDFNELKKNNQNARDYFKKLIKGKDDKISDLEGKLKQIATKLGTDSSDPTLSKKVEDLVDEVKNLRVKVKTLETQKPSSSSSSPSVPSSTTSNDALQKQKQAKEDELQNYLKSLKSRLGSDYPENKIKDFLQAEIKLGRTGKKNAPESTEYQGWNSSRGVLVEEGYVEEAEINRLSQLQAEIVQLEIQIEKQLITQVEAGNKG